MFIVVCSYCVSIQMVVFCSAMLCVSAAYAVMLCPSVSLPHSCIVSKRVNIFSMFLYHRVATPLVFSHQIFMTIFDRNPVNVSVECRWSVNKIAVFDQYLALSQK